MSDFTYCLPFSKEQFFKGILLDIKRQGETNLFYYLKGGRISIDDLGTSYYVDRVGRWDANGINIKIHVNSKYLDLLECNSEYKSILFKICNNLIPGEVGYDIKDIIFVRDLALDLDLDEDDDIMQDLENQIKDTSKTVLKKILPEELVEKGYEMSEVYTYLYSVENSLRLFIEIVAKEQYGEGYMDKLILPSALKNKISSRKDNAKSKKWLSLRGDSDLFYIDFVELGSIINSNWNIFKQYFNSQDFILPKINEMADCRNLIAHNSYISKENRDLIKSYYNSIIMQISIKFNDNEL